MVTGRKTTAGSEGWDFQPHFPSSQEWRGLKVKLITNREGFNQSWLRHKSKGWGLRSFRGTEHICFLGVVTRKDRKLHTLAKHLDLLSLHLVFIRSLSINLQMDLFPELFQQINQAQGRNYGSPMHSSIRSTGQKQPQGLSSGSERGQTQPRKLILSPGKKVTGQG